jgi:hypothetical protein
MFKESNDTFTLQLFMRTFTFSNKDTRTEETLSFNNIDFIGDDLIINYTNT